MKALVLGAAIAASCTSAPAERESPWPAGSKLVLATVCFEHEVSGEWLPLVLVSPSGVVPHYRQSAEGEWRIPEHEPKVRLLVGCAKPRAAPSEESGP